MFTTRHAISLDFTWPRQRQVADLLLPVQQPRHRAHLLEGRRLNQELVNKGFAKVVQGCRPTPVRLTNPRARSSCGQPSRVNDALASYVHPADAECRRAVAVFGLAARQATGL